MSPKLRFALLSRCSRIVRRRTNSSRTHGAADQCLFFPRPGITLFTAPATDDAIVATTPFLGFRPLDRLLADLDFDFDPAFDVVFDFVVPLDFAAAFFAIADTATP